MNNKQLRSRYQPLTPEALVHIADLAERDSIGSDQRCARFRRRNRTARSVIGVAAVAALVVIVLAPPPDSMYLSNPEYRAEAVYNIDQTLLANL